VDALLWYGIGVAALGLLGAAGRWADSALRKPFVSPGRVRFARLVRKFTLAAFYLAFAFGVATVLYAVGTFRLPASCSGPGCPL
jgi:hypothetical protein